MHILLVDPDPDHTWMLCETLTSAGHTVVDTPDPHFALEFLHGRRFDAAVLDIAAARDKDADLIAVLKQDWTNPKIIVMADFQTRSVEKDLTRRGAHHFLAKPADIEHLLALLSEQESPGSSSEHEPHT
jgi:two-component system response regulator RegA